MNLPATLRVAGLEYPLRLGDKSEIRDEAYGWIRFAEQEIWIRDDLSLELQTSIVVHEALHAIDYAADLKMSERQVSAASRLLYALLLDNPELLELLAAQAKKR